MAAPVSVPWAGRTAPALVARALQARAAINQMPTGVVVNVTGATVTVDIRNSWFYDVKVAVGLVLAINDVVMIRRDIGGMVVLAKIGTSVIPDNPQVSTEPYHEPQWTQAPVFTGTWRDGRWARDVGGPYGNECQWGIREGIESMGVAYFGRGLKGNYVYTADAYWLGIVRLPAPGYQPTNVRLSLLAGLRPTDAGPTVLDTLDLPLTGLGMADHAERLIFNAQGWETRFMSGEAGGLGLARIPADPDHLQRAAGAFGLSMTVTGYPAWVL